MSVIFVVCRSSPNENKSVRKCFFVSNPDSPYFQSDVFVGILKFLQHGTNKARLKQVGKNGILIIDQINTMSDLHEFLQKMQKSI